MPQARLRGLTAGERTALRNKLRDKTLSVRVWERYRVVKELDEGRAATEIADRVGCHVTVVYDWLHRFNASGFASFEAVPNPKGRPAIIKSEQVRALIKVATSRPDDLGLAFTDWSVAKLHAYCQEKGLLPPCTDEWVRRLLRREGLTYQRSKTWKQSNDPEFEQKKGASWPSTRRRRKTE